MLSKKKYEKLCRELDESDIYDGREELDIYTCQSCGKKATSVCRDKGCTPCGITCGCGGHMWHTKTLPYDGSSVDIKWVRPTYEYYAKLSPAAQEHVENGGLVKQSDLIGLVEHQYD